jgi:hypothetical protein
LGQALAYVYFEDGWDQARRIEANIAELPDLLHQERRASALDGPETLALSGRRAFTVVCP